MVKTSNGDVPAKDLKEGDVLLVPSLAEMGPDSPDDDMGAVLAWDNSSLTFLDMVETTIESIGPRTNSTVFFNNRSDAKFSLTQPIYIRREESYRIVTTGSVKEGDFLVRVSESGDYEEELVESITTDETLEATYMISCEPYDWFIAGGYLAHNK